MHRKVFLMNHFIEQKFTLMPPEEKHPSSSDQTQCSRGTSLITTLRGCYRATMRDSHHPLCLSYATNCFTSPSARKTRYPASEALCYQSVLHCFKDISIYCKSVAMASNSPFQKLNTLSRALLSIEISVSTRSSLLSVSIVTNEVVLLLDSQRRYLKYCFKQV